MADTEDRPDADLVHAVSRGGQQGADAFAQLYERHAARLLAFACGQVGRADGLDVCQDAWARVWKNLADFTGGNFRAWIFRIARNLIIDRGRRARTLPLGEQEIEDRRPAESDANDERHELARCLERLPPEMRDLVRSRLLGEGYEVIAQKMGRPEAHLHKMFHQAKKELQDCVNRDSE